MNRERGSRLVHSEQFLKSKRNVIIWAVSVMALELSHTTGPIAPTALGAEISLPAKFLGIGLILAMLYQLYGFWFERRYVVWQNADLGDSSDGTLAARLERQEQNIDAALQKAVCKGSEAHAALLMADEFVQKIISSAKEQEKAAHDALIERDKYEAALISNFWKVVTDINKYPDGEKTRMALGSTYFSFMDPRLFVHDMRILPIETASLSNNFIDASRSADELADLLKKTYVQLNHVGKQVDIAERRTFRWYDTWLTFGLASLAVISYIANLVRPGALSDVINQIFSN